MERKDLSVVMPALNEQDNIEHALSDTLKGLDHFGINGEVIVINDGSSDETEARVRSFMQRDSRIRMVCHETPRGIGASFWDGVDASCAEAVVMLPGDNENDPSEIFRYFKLLEHVDIVIPFIFNREARPWLRNLLSFVYRFIINTTFLVNFNYTNGTILYRKAVLKEISSRNSGFFFQTDILIRTVKKGYLFAEVPYRLGLRESGRSSAVSFPSFLKVVKGYVRLVRDQYFTKQEKEDGRFSRETQTAIRKGARP